MNMTKDMRKLAKACTANGWRVEPTRGGHVRLLSPDGEHLIIAEATPSDRRSLSNTKARLRRAGLELS